MVAILHFRFPGNTLNSILDITIEFLDPENMGVAGEILSLSCIPAQIVSGRFRKPIQCYRW